MSSIKRVATSRKSLFFLWILLSKGSIILVEFPQNEKVLLEPSMMRFLYRDTPLKINMALKYHPIEKENHLPSTFMTLGSKTVIFPGCKTSFLGRLVSFWDGFLADAMLVSGRVS